MKDKNGKIRYPVQTARISDEEWERLNNNRQRLDLSWNQVIKEVNRILDKL
jgi:hypothetical protein